VKFETPGCSFEALQLVSEGIGGNSTDTNGAVAMSAGHQNPVVPDIDKDKFLPHANDIYVNHILIYKIAS